MVTTPPSLKKIHRRKREKIYCQFCFLCFAFCAHDVIKIEKHWCFMSHFNLAIFGYCSARAVVKWLSPSLASTPARVCARAKVGSVLNIITALRAQMRRTPFQDKIERCYACACTCACVADGTSLRVGKLLFLRAKAGNEDRQTCFQLVCFYFCKWITN